MNVGNHVNRFCCYNMLIMKKSYIFNTLFVFICVFLSSCQKQDDKKCVTIDLGASAEVSMNQLFSKVEVLTLENKGDKFVSGIDNVFPSKDYYIISNRQNVVSVFTKDGVLVSDSKNKIGNGPNEYSVVTAVTYNPYSKNIEIATPRHLLFYDVHFNLVNKVALPTDFGKDGKGFLFFNKICDLSENRHILVPYGDSEKRYDVMLFDSSSKKIVKTKSFTEDVIAMISMQNQSLFDLGKQELSFIPPFLTGYIYSFDKSEFAFSKKFQLQPGKNGLTLEDMKSIGDDENKQKSFFKNSNKEVPLNCMETSGYVTIHMNKGLKLSDHYLLIYNKGSQKLCKIRYMENKKMVFPILKYADADCLYGDADERTLPNILSYLKDNGVKVDMKNQGKGDTYILKFFLK